MALDSGEWPFGNEETGILMVEGETKVFKRLLNYFTFPSLELQF